MNKRTTSFLLVAVALILAFTNPSLDKHKEEVEQILYNQSGILDVTQADLDSFQTVGYALADGAIIPVVDSMVEGVSRDNYALFSLTRTTYKGNSEVIGAGVLGNVFVSDKLKLKNDAKKEDTDLER